MTGKKKPRRRKVLLIPTVRVRSARYDYRALAAGAATEERAEELHDFFREEGKRRAEVRAKS